MQKGILEQICAQIYTDINSILLSYIKSPISKKPNNATKDLVAREVTTYLKDAMKSHLINVMPVVEVGIVDSNLMLTFLDAETGRKIDSLEEIVKMPATWTVSEESI